jgi:UDP-glucose 4-epimerase
MQTILLVGASGTIGSKLCQEFSRPGFPFRCVALSRYPHTSTTNIKYIAGNLNADDVINKIIQINPKKIIFTSSPFHPRVSKGKVFEIIDLFIQPSLYFLSNVLRACNINDVIFLSSYYGIENSLFYSVPVDYHTPYSTEKIIIESALFSMCKEVSANLTLLRIANVYSPDEKKDDFGVINVFAKLIASGLESKISVIDENISKDYIHIDDLCDLLLKIIFKTCASAETIYNVGSGSAATPRQILNALKSLYSSAYSISSFCFSSSSVDISLTTRDFDWSPSFTINDLIQSAHMRFSHLNANA